VNKQDKIRLELRLFVASAGAHKKVGTGRKIDTFVPGVMKSHKLCEKNNEGFNEDLHLDYR
jgi:hypothetical protein